MSRHPLSDEQIRDIVREYKLGSGIPEILEKYGMEPGALTDAVQRPESESPTSTLLKENEALKQIVGDLIWELSVRGQGRNEWPPTAMPEADTRGGNQTGKHTATLETALTGYTAKPARPREAVRSLLERSRIIPAIRGTAYLQAAIASPSLIVWLLYGTPLTLPEIVRQLRSAGKLPIANMDLLTGFAHDADGIELLAAEGVAGVVSTRQSVLRAARAQGIIAVQRTFIVDSIAVGNLTRALQHFLPDAIELLPAAAAPLCVSALRAAQPQLPVIATGLVTNMRQVDDAIRVGVSSVATSDVALWVL